MINDTPTIFTRCLYKPNFQLAITTADQKILEYAIALHTPFKSFKVPLEKMITKLTDLELKTYREAKKYNIDETMFGSESAVLAELDGKYIIFYDDTKPDYHVRFSLAHEWGHYELHHDLDARKKYASLYNKQEQEAHFFAAEILMPRAVLLKIHHRDYKVNFTLIANYFYVSYEAAQKKIHNINSYKNNWRTQNEQQFDEPIVTVFQNAIDYFFPVKEPVLNT